MPKRSKPKHTGMIRYGSSGEVLSMDADKTYEGLDLKDVQILKIERSPYSVLVLDIPETTWDYARSIRVFLYSDVSCY